MAGLRSRKNIQMKGNPAKGSQHPAGSLFPVVGIGASAGGLEALEQFLAHVPPNIGLAFVIVQHLDPTHKGIMTELLQRSTQMTVRQVKDRMKIQKDNVYVIPPNRDMSVLHGVLHLLEPIAPRGMRLPIDFFFRSLAEDQQEHSIGVILSGMGTDGTLGLRAIKEKAGVAFVQEPSSAKFDGMPRSAIEAGLADIVAPAAELPESIIAFVRHAPPVGRPEPTLETRTQSALEKIQVLLRVHTGHDFSLYKKSTVYRRIERRMGIHRIDRIAKYVRYLQENAQERDLLFNELLIGVTSFFRDPAAWEQLGKRAIPGLLASRPVGGTLRAWVAGCSTGEEAYSLAIVFKEALETFKPHRNCRLQIFGTDLDRAAIDIARQGLFPANVAADVSPERLRRFFIKEEGGYRVGKAIRELVIFAPQNLIMDPPFTKLDVLLCRNLLIYLTPELQKRLLPLFNYSLNPGGILFLGAAETVSGFTSLFAPLDAKSRIFRRSEHAVLAEPVEFPPAFVPGQLVNSEAPKTSKPTGNLQSLVDQVLLQKYSPAAVLANSKGDILYISGRTGEYLEPPAGKANWNVLAMAREGLRYELAAAFRKAVRERKPIRVKGLRAETGAGQPIIDLTVHPIENPEALQGTLLIVLSEREPPAATSAAEEIKVSPGRHPRQAELEKERQQLHAELQTTREEMQTSQEELRSTNEELQSSNEELQSTNEELTTSKEEMQSLNEELQTVNAELQSKVDELSRASNDMNNLLNSTDIAIIFLDDELRVRRFTTQAARIINLIATDVGRPITDISSGLIYPDMAQDTKEVLRTLVPVEKEIAAGDGRWFAMRILPYRTSENRIDGVVITFNNITSAKMPAAELREKGLRSAK